PEPDWNALLGGESEAAWIADRDRKLAKATQLAATINQTFDQLASRGAVYRATPAILLEIPFAGLWYVSLAGFSQKTLQNIRLVPRSFGMTVTPITLVKGLSSRTNSEVPSASVRSNLSRFCDWINEEIRATHPEASRDPRTAIVT